MEITETPVKNLRYQLWTLIGKGWRLQLIAKLKEKGHDFLPHYVSHVLAERQKGPHAGMIIDAAIELRDEAKKAATDRIKAIQNNK
jgi:hypothetical protein